MLNQIAISHRTRVSTVKDMMSIAKDDQFGIYLGMTKRKALEGEDGRTFAERLRIAMDHAGLPPTDKGSALGERLGLSRQTCNQWVNAIAVPELALMVKIADSLEVNPLWLALGDRPMEVGRGVSPDELEVVHIYRRLKTLNKIAADTWKSEGIEKADIAEWRQSQNTTAPRPLGSFKDQAIPSGQLASKTLGKQKRGGK